ncbi:MAG TPA: hypothetical protein VFV62_02520 [Gaiellaceae bacterium]|nr:hypothetical protein [Gaiellaceae bacterium]
MEADDRAARNAAELNRRLAGHEHMTARDEADTPSREAVAHLDAYVSLLRQAPSIAADTVPASVRRVMVKLEFDDGSWDITEGDVEDRPSVGDRVRLADGRISKFREFKTVLSGRSRKPPRKIVVCTLQA